jgi:exodeoxyribonuclease VII large subunit
MEDYSNNTIQQREIHSVTEINQTASDFLNEAFPPLWVAGEISNFKEYGTSGHWYFSIKDSNSVLSCTMFRMQNSSLRFKPKEGDQVIMQGKLSIYAKSGRYQLIASKMELAGFGELMRKYELLKNKLNSEGLFEKKTIDDIPVIVNRIGVITSQHGAAIKDVISTIKRRSPHMDVVISPCRVQGDGSAQSVLKSLKEIELHNEKNKYDAVIICRGGGSIEDLWCFNDEQLCRYIADYPIPVVSGVGHETDFTLTDFVSNLRAATPTAAAEIVSEGASNLNDYFLHLKDRLLRETSNLVMGAQDNLNTLKRLLRSPRQRLEEQYQKLDAVADRLIINTKLNLNAKKSRQTILETKINSLSPLASIANRKNQIMYFKKEICEKHKTMINNKQGLLKLMHEKLIALNPGEILNRGYSITFDEKGKTIASAKNITNGDLITTKLADGKIKSKVTD